MAQQYNAATYGVSQYNLQVTHYQVASETISSADVIIPSQSFDEGGSWNGFQYNKGQYNVELDAFVQPPSEVVGMADIIAFTHTVGECDERYNALQYNGCQYNFEGVSKAVSIGEIVNLSDDLLKLFIRAPLTDSMSFSDAILNEAEVHNLESVLLDETTFALKPSKGFSEAVRLAIWLDQDRNPAQNDWGDQ